MTIDWTPSSFIHSSCIHHTCDIHHSCMWLFITLVKFIMHVIFIIQHALNIYSSFIHHASYTIHQVSQSQLHFSPSSNNSSFNVSRPLFVSECFKLKFFPKIKLFAEKVNSIITRRYFLTLVIVPLFYLSSIQIKDS